MAQARKATRNAVGGELSETQVEAEFARTRDPGQRIKRAATLRTIKRYFEADEFEVTSKKISLICPISKARVKVPVRSVNCRHMECFDLRSYLNYHQRLTYWECPFSCCKAQARCESLRMDEYMSEVLRAIDDRAQEVEVFADGSFKAVQRTTPTEEETETIDDEDPYIPDSGTEPNVKVETNDDNGDETMETAVFPADEGQSQSFSPAADGEEQSREALRHRRPQSAMLRCELGSASNRPEQAEPNVSKLRDENYRLCEEPAATAQDTCGLATKNQEQQARLDLVPTAAEATQQTDHEPIEADSFSMDHDPHESSPSLADEDAYDDAAQATTDDGASELGQPLPKQDDDSSSDASIPLPDLSQRKKKQKGNFTCAECGRGFSRRGDLSRHQRTHIGDKPFKCGQCGAEFTQSSSLRRHERAHSGEKPYRCGQCGAEFTQSSSLRRHERTHSGEKPYKCGQCGATFTESGHFRQHERTHTGVKPYTCGQCGAAFTQSTNLRTHVRIHTGERPYKCGQCDKAYADPSNLRKHERTQHPVAGPSKEVENTAVQADCQSEA